MTEALNAAFNEAAERHQVEIANIEFEPWDVVDPLLERMGTIENPFDALGVLQQVIGNVDKAFKECGAAPGSMITIGGGIDNFVVKLAEPELLKRSSAGSITRLH